MTSTIRLRALSWSMNMSDSEIYLKPGVQQMRNILWEAREAAEFAASARTAAAAQRANDCREMCATLRAHKSTARKHKRDMIQVGLSGGYPGCAGDGGDSRHSIALVRRKSRIPSRASHC